MPVPSARKRARQKLLSDLDRRLWETTGKTLHQVWLERVGSPSEIDCRIDRRSPDQFRSRTYVARRQS